MRSSWRRVDEDMARLAGCFYCYSARLKPIHCLETGGSPTSFFPVTTVKKFQCIIINFDSKPGFVYCNMIVVCTKSLNRKGVVPTMSAIRQCDKGCVALRVMVGLGLHGAQQSVRPVFPTCVWWTGSG